MGKFAKLFSLTVIFLSLDQALASDVSSADPFQTADPNWPRQCMMPFCEAVNRSLRYPSTIARQFYQCNFINNTWQTTIVQCRCETLFDYIMQGCVRFDVGRVEWCLNTIDQSWLPCGEPFPPPTTTTAPGTDPTPVPTPAPPVTTEPPPTGSTVWTPPGGTPPPLTPAPTPIPPETPTTAPPVGNYTTVTWS